MKKYKPYTGIGSRQTPPEILALMTELAKTLAKKGLTLRSGGADGADSAFEAGAGENKEIFLPWKGFNQNPSGLYTIPEKAFSLAGSVHPAWGRLSQGARKLHARNTQQALGQNLDQPSIFLIFYAPEKNGTVQGGTATAVALARKNGIPTHNLKTSKTLPPEWEELLP